MTTRTFYTRIGDLVLERTIEVPDAPAPKPKAKKKAKAEVVTEPAPEAPELPEVEEFLQALDQPEE